MTYYDDVYRGSPTDLKEPTRNQREDALVEVCGRADVGLAYDEWADKNFTNNPKAYGVWVAETYAEQIEELAYELANAS